MTPEEKAKQEQRGMEILKQVVDLLKSYSDNPSECFALYVNALQGFMMLCKKYHGKDVLTKEDFKKIFNMLVDQAFSN